ncbi:uncharacterized protein LOC125043220 [Penaeus chinensis]|uniref:uncharacterized protein LOC125043220 n=1 Tax=Penaeus chinensis TaxID=139456 RepID=UPI001FB73BEE|nr:uncharacterized protein LOC125043220 [Penaeus chinensis]
MNPPATSDFRREISSRSCALTAASRWCPDIRLRSAGAGHSLPTSPVRRKCINSTLLITTMSQSGRPGTRGDTGLNASGLDKDSDPKGCVGDKSQDNSDSTVNKSTMYSIKRGEDTDSINEGGRGESLISTNTRK